MAAQTYRYLILRYIPDPMRMEPRNVGVIVQSDDGIVHRIHGHFQPHSAGDRAEARANFRAWREWFEHELRAPIGHSIVPERTSEAYLSYLASRCTGSYQLTEPLRLQAEADLDGALDFLYTRLVLAPGEKPEAATRAPVRRFRQAVDDLGLEAKHRGLLLHNQYIDFGDVCVPSFYAYRNGRTVLIDKVEIDRSVRRMQLELEALCRTAGALEGRGGVELVALIDPPDLLEAEGQPRDETFVRQYRERSRYIEDRATQVISAAADAGAYAERLAEELEAVSSAA